MNNKTILTDDQILRTLSIVHGCSVSDVILHDAIAARRIEQAVLQSEQVQVWKRDAERYKWLKDQFRILSLDMGGKHSWALQRPIREGSTIDEVCDAAMEQKK